MVTWVVGGWWVRNTENKAQLRPAVPGALPELGNIEAACCLKIGQAMGILLIPRF